jgi:ubiquinone/menaquinone biosynthesis C-methylase UbiE
VNNNALQRDTFMAREGDGYFERNAASLERGSHVRDLVLERLAHHLNPTATSRVLEIGCASGVNLSVLGQMRPIEGLGIDPSQAAVQAGSQRFPALSLIAGSAENLPYEDASVDAVWFGFCLYLVDRSLLHRVVAEADRVLKDGGLLAIHDFDPDLPSVRPYRHHEGLNSYKMDYSRLFLADPAYVLAEKVSFSHQSAQWSDDAQERVGFWVCRKNTQTAYRPALATP